MKTAFVALFGVLCLIPCSVGLTPREEPATGNGVTSQPPRLDGQVLRGGTQGTSKAEASAITFMNNLPLYFVENRGQVRSAVKYAAKIRNGIAYFTGDEIVYQFLLESEAKDGPREKPFPPEVETAPGTTSARRSLEVREETIRVSFLGANKHVRPEGQGEQEAKFNYFRGDDPRRWISGARTYQNVIYRDLYPNTNLVVAGREGRLKNEYVVRAGGDPSAIRVRYNGAKALRVNEKGQLEIQTATGRLIEDAPLSYQIIGGKTCGVSSRYLIAADETVRFEVGAYRKDVELIIDPLSYSTFLGGWTDDWGYGIAVDGSGNAYVTGYTNAADFPATAGAYDTSYNGAPGKTDVFVTKLNASGSALLYSTFLGGAEDDIAYGIAVDGIGNAHVAGRTYSSDFPTTSGAYDIGYHGAGDVFITKLNATGSALLYSTFLGGTSTESGSRIATDGIGNACVAGSTSSSNFPTSSGAYDIGHNGSDDVFIAKLNSSGSALLYSTFLGGTGSESGQGLALDGNGNAYVTGSSGSGDFPATAGAYDTSFNGGTYDCFVTKLDSSGGTLLYSTFLGGTSSDLGAGIAVDGSGNAYATGMTNSSDFPTTSGAYDIGHNGSGDVFITKLDSSGSVLLYSTFLGGTGSESGFGKIAVDGSGSAYVTGMTNSSDFPTTAGAFDNGYNGMQDVFVSKLNSSGNALLYSTYLGRNGNDIGYGIAIDGSGNAYVTGFTICSDFPTTPGAYDIGFNGSSDAFITKLPTRLPDIRQPISALIFGSVNIGSTADGVTVIANDGDADLTINSLDRTSGSNDFTFVEPNIPFTIPAGGDQSIKVRFAPTSGGQRLATFTVNTDDPDEPSVTFDASGIGMILAETVSTPSTPVGTTSGFIGTSYSFATGNSMSNLGHNVQYYFEWGDGTNTGWLAVGTFSAQKSWSSANTYNVTAKARCATDTAIESSTSSALAVNILVQGRDNSPSNYQIIPECIWASATGGGTWASEVQVTDITGGSVVSVYFDYGGGNRRGPFTLWTSPGVNRNMKDVNILSSIDALDSEAFTYYGRVGTVEFSTQDSAHKIQVTARTLNGNFSKTFPGLNLTDSNTANTSRRMIVQNFTNNATYRSTCGFFNPTADSVTLELKLIDQNGSQIGSTITRTLVAYDFQSFSPFNQAGVPYPGYSYDNVVLWITPTSGSGKVMVFGASANNTSNDPAAHIGVQYQ